MLGFTINTLTLFGLVLAIGIVVDDAIVVIENVERIMEEEHLPPRQAADKAIRQVAGALVAIVLSLCAVFVPVAFMSGITGALYKEFALTIVIAVVISGMVALTLTPALCAGLADAIRPRTPPTGSSWPSIGVSTGCATGTSAPRGGIVGRPQGRHRGLPGDGGAHAACSSRRVPSAFIPPEDKGFFVMAVQLPDAASRQRTEEVVSRIEKMVLADSSVVGRRDAGRPRPAHLLQSDQQRDDVRPAQALGGAHAQESESRCDHREDQLWPLRHQGGLRLRIQLPGDSRAGPHQRARDESAGANRDGLRGALPPRCSASFRTPTSSPSSRAPDRSSRPTSRRCT